MRGFSLFAAAAAVLPLLTKAAVTWNQVKIGGGGGFVSTDKSHPIIYIILALSLPGAIDPWHRLLHETEGRRIRACGYRWTVQA